MYFRLYGPQQLENNKEIRRPSMAQITTKDLERVKRQLEAARKGEDLKRIIFLDATVKVYEKMLSGKNI